MVFSLEPFGSICKISWFCFYAGVSKMNVEYMFDSISGCVSAFICPVYCVFKDLPV